MQPSIRNRDEMDEAEQAFWTELVSSAAHDDGRAAEEHLTAGFPIYFREDGTPEGLVIKQYPDGRRELVSFDRTGERPVQANA